MSIQDLRIARQELVDKARALLDNNPGASFTAKVQSKVDDLHAQIDKLDREMDALEKVKAWGPQAPAGSVEWRDENGRTVPVAYANRGSMREQLSDAFPDARASDALSMSDFLRSVAGQRAPEKARNALTVGTDSQGCYLLPAYLQMQMLEALAPVSSLLTAGAGLSILDQGAKSYRIAAVSTIPTAAWRSESGAVAVSDPAFRSVDLIPRSLAFGFKVSREALADAQNLEEALFRVIAVAFAKELDRAGLRGSGSAPEIRGILNTSNIQSVTNGGAGTSLATIKFSNLISGVQAILAADAPMPTAAIVNPRTLTGFASLADSTAQPLRMPPLLEGIKMIATSQIPINLTVGASTDTTELYLADFSQFTFFIREGVSIQLARDLYAATAEVGSFAHVRADVAVLYPQAFCVCTGIRP